MAREIISRAPLKVPEGKVAAVILVHLTHNNVTPYVTWLESKDGDTYLGRYHRDLAEAEKEFSARCKSVDTHTPIPIKDVNHV